jgi:hypothetical protein
MVRETIDWAGTRSHIAFAEHEVLILVSRSAVITVLKIPLPASNKPVSFPAYHAWIGKFDRRLSSVSFRLYSYKT